MDLQVTPSQQRYSDAHRQRLDRLWPAKVPKAKIKPQAIAAPLPLVPTPREWFVSAWQILDGPYARHSIREIQSLVCEHFGVPHLYMESSRRNHAYYLPRATAIYLCKRFTSQSYPAISRMFGNRDHTTIISCVKSVEKMIALNHPIANDIEILSAKLEGANQ